MGLFRPPIGLLLDYAFARLSVRNVSFRKGPCRGLRYSIFELVIGIRCLKKLISIQAK